MKVLALSAVCALFATHAVAGLEVKIGSTQRGLQEGNGEVMVVMTNNSTENVRIERWNTPLFGVLDDVFHIELNGVEVPYTGVHAKWGTPGKSDWVEFEPGQTMSAKVKLSDHYDLFQTGTYAVRFDAHQQTETANKSFVFGEVESSQISLFVNGNGYSEMAALKASAANALNSNKAAAQFKNCSTTRQSQLNTAFSSAKTYASNSLSYFTNRTTANITARYRTWFGSATTTRIATAKSHYNNISSSLQNKQIVFNCSCASQYASAFAYVQPSSPYEITLCGAFWPAANTGTDSKAGTIVHEMSHFNIVAGTDDHAYGQSAAKSLATSNVTKALDNADSHEYFSENTPAQN
jgi:peptidyl-Lys metalloendopeptidase